MNTEIINLAPVTIDSQQFKDTRLAEATARIARIYQNAAKYADEKNREISTVLATVASEKSYEKDGFKSVADYAYKTFGIARQNAYSLAAAGRLYNDERVPDKVKALTPSKLAEVASVPISKLQDAAESGAISAGKTQKELREFASSVKESTSDGEPKKKTTVLDSYTARTCMTMVPDTIAAELENPRIMEDWDNFFIDQLAGLTSSDTETVEVVKLPKGYASLEAKKATVPRFLYFNRSFSIVVEYFKCSPKAAVQVTATKKYTIDELKAMLETAMKESSDVSEDDVSEDDVIDDDVNESELYDEGDDGDTNGEAQYLGRELQY